jgi:glycosyltransferase involved in cell wall biosynthesis
MRTTFISTMSGYPWGGSEELWSGAAFRLCGEGHTVAASVAYWPQQSPRVSALAAGGISLYVRKPGRRNWSARIVRRVKNKFSTGEGEDSRWLRLQHADLVVISQGGSVCGLHWMKLCFALRLPFVIIVQSNKEAEWPNDEFGAELRTGYCVAKGIFCVSRHNLELLRNQLGESLPQATIAWNPFNLRLREPCPWPDANGVVKLACVARLEPPAKGQDILLEIFAQKKWRERQVELNFYGEGPWRRSLVRMAERLELKNVFFRGHVSDIAEIWRTNLMLVLPSRYEGLPLALVESMFCGRPAVVTDVGGNAEVCTDGETGFIASAPIVSSVDGALERAWTSRAEWPAMGAAAHKRAMQLIPTDPIGEFCKQLKSCVSGDAST